MKLIIDIPDDIYKFVCQLSCEDSYHYDDVVLTSVKNGTPIPDNATNGDVIMAMFGDDKVSAFMGYVRIMARVGNWFNEGVVAEFDDEWWNAPYQKGGK